MSALQHVSRQRTICSAVRQLLLIPRQSFSLSMHLEGRQRKQEKKITTRFARIVPPVPRTNEPTTDEDMGPPVCKAVEFDPKFVDNLFQKVENDMPLSDIPDPFTKDYHRCYICTNNIKFDYKNVRLLSQFVSPYTGRIYGRAITGLCIPMQEHVESVIKTSRFIGYMPLKNKDPRYLQDPTPFNPMAKRN